MYVRDDLLDTVESALVVKKLPGGVYRIKCVLYTDEEPEYRVVFQVVGKRVDVVRERRWDGKTPKSRVVTFGAPGSIIQEYVAQVLSAYCQPVLGSIESHHRLPHPD